LVYNREQTLSFLFPRGAVSAWGDCSDTRKIVLITGYLRTGLKGLEDCYCVVSPMSSLLFGRLLLCCITHVIVIVVWKTVTVLYHPCHRHCCLEDCYCVVSPMSSSLLFGRLLLCFITHVIVVVWKTVTVLCHPCHRHCCLEDCYCVVSPMSSSLFGRLLLCCVTHVIVIVVSSCKDGSSPCLKTPHFEGVETELPAVIT
jgi:hypothetical protein